MTACVYLIQNRDLYKIGRSENFEKRLKSLRPCNVIQVYKTDRSRDLEIELHRKYKHCRLPGTEYFRLNDKEVDEVCVALGVMDKLPETVEPRVRPEWITALRSHVAWYINQPDFDPTGIPDIEQIRKELKQEFPEYFPHEKIDVTQQPKWRKALRKGLARVINEPDFDPAGIANIDEVRKELRQEWPEYFKEQAADC